jgi:prephenate dehydratase
MTEGQPVVAFQGEHGAYSEQAARQHFGNAIATLPCRTFHDLIAAVQDGRARFGFLPVENSLAGTVISAYDLLMDCALHIQAEVILRVEHCLMAPTGTTLAGVRRARSHPQALLQCEATLRRMSLEPVEYYDTAGAARDLAADPQPGVAAIASALAAETYGLDILARHLEDKDINFTRFFVLGRERPARRDPSKTSIVLATPHAPGALHAALGELARRAINMTKIESRPQGDQPWHYWFYIDFEGHEEEEAVREALQGIRRRASFLRVLGSYPAARPA